MKYKKIILLYTTIIISCSSTLSFANQIKTIKQDNNEYIPLEEVVKKAGGSFNKVNNDIDIKIDNKTISLSLDNSFAKINEKYHPMQTTEMDGFIIPKDTKSIEKDNTVYIHKDFLKNQKIIDYKVENNVVTINSSTNIQTSRPNSQIEENNNTQHTTETRPNNNSNTINNNTNNNRPSRPSIGNNSNSTSSNRPNTGNNNNNTSNDRPTTENNSSNNNSNSNSGNTQEPPIIQDTEQPTLPETPSDSPTGDSGSQEVSENITE